jgi:GNAT superfamily N-acetyltransferase
MEQGIVRLGSDEVVLTIDGVVDVAELQSLYNQIGWNGNGFLTQPVLRKMLTGSYAFVTAEIDGVLVGFARVVSDGVCATLIVDVMTHQNFRKRGIASALMRFLMNYLDAKVRFSLLVDSSRIGGFYEHFSFVSSNPNLEHVMYRDRDRATAIQEMTDADRAMGDIGGHMKPMAG